MLTSRRRKVDQRDTVVLTRDQIKTIIEDSMGWEPIDTRSFWRLARKETAYPGILRRELKVLTDRISARIKRGFGDVR